MLRLVSRVEQGLRTRRHFPSRRIEHNVADHRSDRRVTRLERLDDLMTRISQPLAQQLDLSRLAHPVTALEDDEDPAHSAHAPSFFFVLAHTSTNSRRARRTRRDSRSKSRPAANAWTGSSLATCSAVTSSRR